MSVLKADHISIQFGGLRAVNDFSIDLNMGDIHAIIGPNGAGKTTVFNMLTGIYQPTEGTVYVNDKDMTGCKAYQFTQAGLGEPSRTSACSRIRRCWTTSRWLTLSRQITASSRC